MNKPSGLTKFMWTCAGVDKDILLTCPRTDWVKFSGVGATVLFTGMLATLSGGYALFMVFENVWAAVAFGVFWGLIIFNLDRFIVSTIKKEGSFVNQFWQAFPRIVLAIILGIVISKPLELKIFEKEISQRLDEKRSELADDRRIMTEEEFSEITALKSEKDRMRAEIRELEVRTNKIYTDFISEAEGTGGTGRQGKGPVYREKKMEYDRMLEELEAKQQSILPVIADREQRVKQLTAEFDKQMAENKERIANYDGLEARLDALGFTSTSFFVMCLLICIELAPVFTKLLTKKSPYDDILASKEHAIEIEELTKINTRNHNLNKELTLFTSLDQSRIQQEVENNEEALKIISTAHLDLVKESVEIWLEGEKQKIRDERG